MEVHWWHSCQILLSQGLHLTFEIGCWHFEHMTEAQFEKLYIRIVFWQVLWIHGHLDEFWSKPHLDSLQLEMELSKVIEEAKRLVGHVATFNIFILKLSSHCETFKSFEEVPSFVWSRNWIQWSQILCYLIL